jgi:hypothetical protein
MKKSLIFDYVVISIWVLIMMWIDYMSWNLTNRDVLIGLIVIFIAANAFTVYRLCKHIDKIEEKLQLDLE